MTIAQKTARDADRLVALVSTGKVGKESNVTSTITCDYCHQSYEYEDDAVDGVGTLECLPDGYFLPSGEWMCDTCGSCPKCGRTLEKEPDKRGPDAKSCRHCETEGE